MQNYKYDGTKKFTIKNFDCADQGEFSNRQEAINEFVSNLEKINEYQQKLFAEKKEGIIFVFQAMDAAGKDGAVRAVLSCLSPQGVSEHSFKVPSAEEGRHDYLWRFWKALPEKGSISILNRSYYEDVLVQKVHSYYNNYQWADRIDRDKIIEQRYEQIRGFEKHLWENSFRVIKIFLNVSKEEQGRRFLSRIDTPKKNWKFSSGDIEEREYWDEYMKAYETCINKTARENTPWYVVPADHKWYARLVISRIILDELEKMDPKWPVLAEKELSKMAQYRARLAVELSYSEQGIKDELDVSPADTAISIAYKEDRKSYSAKKLRKKLKQYLSNKITENYEEISEETIATIEEDLVDKEELQAQAELEAVKEISSLYKNNKKQIKQNVEGYGKEAKKLYKKFKKESKNCLESYENNVNVFYNEYENAVISYVGEYSTALLEENADQQALYTNFLEQLEVAYNLNRDNALILKNQTIEDLNHLLEKYNEISKIFHSTKSLIKTVNKPVEETETEETEEE